MKTNFWKAAIWSGIIAALVMLLLEMIMNPLFLGNSMWGPSRMIGAILIGSEVLPPPATFDFGVLMAAAAVHFPLSIVFALIIGYLIRKVSVGMAIGIGAGIGLVLYLINFYGFTALFPWFANARNWVQIVIHILFGVAVAWPFKAMYKEHSVT
ncbi:MAG: hypothetical protein ACOCXD_01025 [Bacteroidota bacterium]